MPLTIGARFGPYEILAPLGVGGMGEVYRARDTKLQRDVAIKVLLPAVANDPDRLARFSREAQVLASLNHPSIAQIYGLEGPEGREGNAPAFLVMELVEGEELAHRIARGPIPLDEALPIARQTSARPEIRFGIVVDLVRADQFIGCQPQVFCVLVGGQRERVQREA